MTVMAIKTIVEHGNKSFILFIFAHFNWHLFSIKRMTCRSDYV